MASHTDSILLKAEKIPIVEKVDFSEDDVLGSWILTATPYPVLLIVVFYLAFVLKIGPKFMEKRQPYNLKGIMMVYNLYQILFNGYLVGLLVTDRTAQTYLINHSCRPLDPSKNPLRQMLLFVAWAYQFSKVTDLLDTFFMVFRKKYSHITFLHLYHHTAMVLCSWYCTRYIKAEQGVIPGFINCFVHVIMYTYYFLAALGPGVQKYLWWKRYITKLQLTQFAVVISFWVYLHFNDCEVSQAYNVIWITNVFVIMCLFINFYIKTYIQKPLKEKQTIKSD